MDTQHIIVLPLEVIKIHLVKYSKYLNVYRVLAHNDSEAPSEVCRV